MSDRALTVIVSDLHMGGGPDDPGDDHVYQGRQFVRFVEQLTSSSEGRNGDLELYINGDFLEFAQVRPDVYTLRSSRYWCSEAESLLKLEAIAEGHRDVFQTLEILSGIGNRVTVAAGNHDVDLYWPAVQERLRALMGKVDFVTGQTWDSRYEGRLQIAHGHQVDPVNTFASWHDPILDAGSGLRRLEMCPGTLFMVKFVNSLEDDYPFADNIRPLWALAPILARERKWGLLVAAWMLARFAGRHPVTSLDAKKMDVTTDVPDRLRKLAAYDDQLLTDLQAFVARAPDHDDARSVEERMAENRDLDALLRQVLAGSSGNEWLSIFDRLPVAVTLGTEAKTLGMLRSEIRNDVKRYRKAALGHLDGMSNPGQIVTLGHTHQPDHQKSGEDVYFNTGSWTRFVPYTKSPKLTLKALEREEDFPYELNALYVRPKRDGKLAAQMVCFERATNG